ncbi:hypothetical protein DYB38_001093, partial [Aphanomyces astaci]
MAIATARHGASHEDSAAPWIKGGDTCRFVHRECSANPMFRSEYVRCFPHCCGAHRESTFCGSSITVQCTDHQVMVYGRFEEADDNARMQPHVAIGTILKLSDILGDEKTAASPFGMWMVGASVGNHHYEINKSKLSWHYGWVSSRFNSKTLHRFQVYVFQQTTPQQVRCVAKLASPSFSLCSSRKTRKKAALVIIPTKVEPVASSSSSPPLALVKSEPPPAPYVRMLPPPPPIKIEMPSFESFLRHEPTRPRTFSAIDQQQHAPKRIKTNTSVDDLQAVKPSAPASPTPSSIVTLFSDLIKDDYCRMLKDCPKQQRVSRYDYIDRAMCLSQIHDVASSIISFASLDGTRWDDLAEATSPLHGFMVRCGEWESISIYECRPRTHDTDDSYDHVLTFCLNAMRHCIRTGMIARLRSFLHSHAASIFKPELLDQAYADFIVFFEQEIESYVFPRKRMQCAAFLAYLRRNLPLELVSQLGTPPV